MGSFVAYKFWLIEMIESDLQCMNCDKKVLPKKQDLTPNMLLPFDALLVSEDPTTHTRDKPRPVQPKSSSDESEWSSSNSSSSVEIFKKQDSR